MLRMRFYGRGGQGIKRRSKCEAVRAMMRLLVVCTGFLAQEVMIRDDKDYNCSSRNVTIAAARSNRTGNSVPTTGYG